MYSTLCATNSIPENQESTGKIINLMQLCSHLDYIQHICLHLAYQKITVYR